MSINVGLVGPKTRAKAVADGHPVNIPEPEIFRPARTYFNANQDQCLRVLVKRIERIGE